MTTVVPDEEPRPANDPHAVAPGESSTPRGGETGRSDWVASVPVAIAVVFLAVSVGVLSLLARQQWIRERRRREADPRGAVLSAWDEVVDRLRLEGVTTARSWTVAEITDAARRRIAAVSRPMERLRHLVEIAEWSPTSPTPPEVALAWEQVDAVLAILDRSRSGTSRVRLALGIAPRPQQPVAGSPSDRKDLTNASRSRR